MAAACPRRTLLFLLVIAFQPQTSNTFINVVKPLEAVFQPLQHTITRHSSKWSPRSVASLGTGSFDTPGRSTFFPVEGLRSELFQSFRAILVAKIAGKVLDLVSIHIVNLFASLLSSISRAMGYMRQDRQGKEKPRSPCGTEMCSSSSSSRRNILMAKMQLRSSPSSVHVHLLP
uniref:Uncharacterized protein n=1 Tax=Hanusia phi TaxID=3032 RepID=A0A6T7RCH7_9CRYP|mmetsp:Transcript_2785/g.6667  ORF Transcript_2785/g.6667 Transcript_2785/m.6667 type:complete len:174 (+) Transcript_2785:222-743(+)